MISLIVAVSKNGVIGKTNDLPWYIPEDLKHFKQVTTGHPVIMGRNTYESIIKRLGHPLPGRRNIVVSKSLKSGQGVEVVPSLEDALSEVDSNADNEAFIIGGEQLYNASLKAKAVDKIYLTEVHKIIEGDRFFPKLKNIEWVETKRTTGNNDKMPFDWVILEKKR